MLCPQAQQAWSPFCYLERDFGRVFTGNDFCFVTWPHLAGFCLSAAAAAADLKRCGFMMTRSL